MKTAICCTAASRRTAISRVAAKVGGSLFVHGRISPTLLKVGPASIETINEAARQALGQLDQDRRRLVADDVIVPFSSLWETHCAVYVEMARLEQAGDPRSMARWADLAEINAVLDAAHAGTLKKRAVLVP